jgi:60 kDa SS-A/Ro ribonucleoprotein
MRNIGSVMNKTDQTSRIPGRPEMIENTAGGYGWETTLLDKVYRFMVMGSESTFYAGQRDRTVQAIDSLQAAIASNGKDVVDIARKVSVDNISPVADYAIFSLAYAMHIGDLDTRRYAASKFNDIVRTGTHLFTFAIYSQQLGRGYGRLMRKVISNWYTSKSPNNLAYQTMKYKERGMQVGKERLAYSHRDLLRLSHVKDDNEVRRLIYQYITKGGKLGKNEKDTEMDLTEFADTEASLIYGMEVLKVAESEDVAASIIRAFRLTHEMVPNEWKGSRKIWEALYENMPMTALIRNLNKLTVTGILAKGEFDNVDTLYNKLTNMEIIIKARVHPISILKAYKQYAVGHGDKGSLTWTPNPDVLEILAKCLELSFGAVPRTGKNYILGVDVSGSMGNICAGMGSLTCAEVAMTMAYATYKIEPHVIVLPFAAELKAFDMNRFVSLGDMLEKTRGMTFGRTDVSLPIVAAIQQNLDIDAFCVYTDYETYAGSMHPAQAIKEYRNKSGKGTASVVTVGLNCPNGFTLADPKDAYMMDIVGFDPGCPRLISDMVTGRLRYDRDTVRMAGGAVTPDGEEDET